MAAFTTLSHAAELKKLADFEEAAKEHNVTLVLPEYPESPEEIKAAVDKVISEFSAIGDRIASLPSGELTFENVIAPFDELYNIYEHRLSPVAIVQNTSTTAELRTVATEEFKRFQEFGISFDYREDIYNAIKAYADTDPTVEGVDKRIFDNVLRDYRRKGFGLSPAKRAEAERVQKEITRLATEFSQNIRETETLERFNKAELEGIPDEFLATLKTGEDEYSFSGKIAAHFVKVLTLAKNEESRKRMIHARSRHAMEANLPVLTKVIQLRTDLANLLGYANWSDYKTETRMAKNEKTVRTFLQDLSSGLQPKFEQELEELRKLKVAETSDSDARINSWDISYYENKLLKEKYEIDLEGLRVYFPYQACLDGMFEVYETIFGITITEIENENPWAKGVTVYVVTDTASGKPLGVFYLDMFPRLGKYTHFAQFGIIPGKLLKDGTYQRPTVALICNFPKPIGDKPSLLSFDNVETLFHEFGHCMHSILTEAEYSTMAGTYVPRDFVEAPSQVLEYWIRDKQVLDLFAADYRDSSKKLPQEVLDNMEAADLATIAIKYRGQIGYGMTDLLLHSFSHRIQVQNVGRIGNDVLAQYFLARPEGSAYVAGFGHLMGYDSGYYGYAWSDVIAADMASVFEDAEGKFMNKELGMRLREEVFSQGDQRDVTDSVEAFLGRPRSMEPFLKMLGLENNNTES
ncbi:MAG: M3 family metallopeptidase [Verrucomicrobiota bacterium]